MEIDEKKLMKSGLNPTLFVTLYAIIYKKDDIQKYLTYLGIYTRAIEGLEKEGYLKITGPDKSKDIVLRKRAITLLGEYNNVEDWYEEYRDTFPQGAGKSGYIARGNKQEVLKKLKEFTEKYPQYSKDQILTATRNYVQRMIRTNSYMQQAHFFIHKKEVGSTLLTELENSKSGEIDETKRITAL